VSSNWDRTPQEIEIELSHRIVLSPFAAKWTSPEKVDTNV
jgi:hypothetical protein